MNIQLTAKEKVTKAKIKMQRNQPFWAYLVLHLKCREAKEGEIPDWAGGGVDKNANLVFNPKWIDKLNIDEVVGFLAHEVFHVAFHHMYRLEKLKDKEQKELWNTAIDIVTNYNLKLAGLTLPSEGLIPDTYNHEMVFPDGFKVCELEKKSAEMVFYEIIKQAKKNGQKPNTQGRMDDHKEGDEEGNSQGKGKKDGKQKGKGMSTGMANADKWKKILAEAGNFAKQRGKLPANMERLIGKLLNPIVSWKTILYKHITNQIPYDFSYRRPSRKSVSTGIYLPRTYRENLDVLIGVDTSGSISQREYDEFMTEIVSVARSFQNVRMTVMAWDTEVQNKMEVSNGNIDKIMKFNLKGGGGTNINCFFKEVIENHSAAKLVLVLTDGFFGRIEEEPNAELVYVITKGGDNRNIESGKQIWLNREE